MKAVWFSAGERSLLPKTRGMPASAENSSHDDPSGTNLMFVKTRSLADMARDTPRSRTVLDLKSHLECRRKGHTHQLMEQHDVRPPHPTRQARGINTRLVKATFSSRKLS